MFMFRCEHPNDREHPNGGVISHPLIISLGKTRPNLLKHCIINFKEMKINSFLFAVKIL